jgi:hypothetical protein
LARFRGVGGSQVMSAVFEGPGWPEAGRMTMRTGRYVPGLTQTVSAIRLPGRLLSLIASIPSTRWRPATVRVPQETAARSAVATVAGGELNEKPAPGSPGWNSNEAAATTGAHPAGPVTAEYPAAGRTDRRWRPHVRCG